MEVLAVLGGVAAITQLIGVAGNVGRILVELVEKVENVPEELRMQQAVLRSIHVKLQQLQSLVLTLPKEASLPSNVCQELQISLLELQKDAEIVANSIKPYDTGKRRVSSFREKLRFQICDRKTLVKFTRHLKASEENLQRTENVVHLQLTSKILQKLNSEPIRDHRHIQPPSNSKRTCQRSRTSLLNADSILRRSGLYGWLIDEELTEEAKSQILACIGFCFPFWLALLSISLEFARIPAPHQDGWTLQWSIQMRYRVQMESPLMKACQRGDVLSIQQLLKEKRGAVNDRTICRGKSALMVAIDCQNFAAIECLLQNGADPNLPDDDQVTPLFAVAGMDPHKYRYLDQIPPTWDSWLETIRLLIQHGADVHENVRGRHMAGLNIVREDSYPKTLEYFRLLAAEDFLQFEVVSGHQCWSALQNALRSASDAVEALKILRAMGVDLCRIMDEGCTALHLAAEWCVDERPIEYLCEMGCREYIDKQDQWGWTALHYAAIARNSAISSRPFSKVEGLLRNGADLSVKGEKNPSNHYDQPEGQFTPTELLRFARPARWDLLMEVLKRSSLSIELDGGGDRFRNAQEQGSS